MKFRNPFKQKDLDEPTTFVENEALVKFDLSGEFYLKYRCLDCGATNETNDDVPYTLCECGSTNIWLTRGKKWTSTHPTKFWEIFETTSDVRVPTRSRDWLVGQERPMQRELMEIARWVHKKKQQQEALRNAPVMKLSDLVQMLGPDKPIRDQGIIELNKVNHRVHFLDPKTVLLEPGNFMKENPGPYVLRISEPGTGKTLMSKILNEEAADLYKENNIELSDALTIENPSDNQRPLVRVVPCHSAQGRGCLAPRIVMQAERGEVSEQKNKQQLIFTLLFMLIGFGGALVTTGLFIMGVYTMQVGILDTWFVYGGAFLGYLTIGAPLLVFPMFIMVLGGQFLFGMNRQHLLNTPYTIVQHDDRPKYLQDATVSDSATLMGSIQWNAYGNTPGLTGPLHKRVIAGIVHRANDLIVSIDEIRNLQYHTAIELLSVMEDGESQIRTRGSGGFGNAEASGILAISTADPVPADFMLISNGNMDMLYDPHSVLNVIKAFFDRFNYGDAVYFETHLDATPQNEIKVVQVITDEISRFRLFPMEKAGVRRIVEYMRSRADNNQRLKIMFRFVIKAILKSFEIALLRKDMMIRGEDVERAIDEFCDTVPQQALAEHLKNRSPFRILQSEGQAFGLVNGLSVIAIPGVEGRSAGQTSPVAAVVFPIERPEGPKPENFVVTGVEKDESSWVQDSKQHVRAAIMKMYGKDLMEHYKTFISFAQSKGVEGPSAGTTMTIAIMSSLGDPRLPEPHDGPCPNDSNGNSLHKRHRKPVPIRQDIAMTGTVELIPTPGEPKNVRVGAIGGVPDKVQGAANAGCKYVVIPQENYNHTLTKEKYPCVILGADSILGYFDIVRADEPNLEALLAMRKPVSDEDIRVWSATRPEQKKVMERFA